MSETSAHTAPCFGNPPGVPVGQGQASAAVEGFGVVGALPGFAMLARLLDHRDGLGVTAHAPVSFAQIEAAEEGVRVVGTELRQTDLQSRLE